MSMKRCQPIGGQALPNGVMMRSPKKHTIALRLRSGKIITDSWPGHHIRIVKKPLLRGIYQLAVSLKASFITIRRAVRLSRKAGEKRISPSAFLSTAAAILLLCLYAFTSGWFFDFLSSQLSAYTHHYLFTFFYGVADLILFCMTVFLVTRLPAVKKLLKYHGAEHKAIACYEKGLDMTLQNVRAQSRFHRRCGTSMVVTILAAIILASVFIPPQLSEAAQAQILGAVMLISAGISYEAMRSKKATLTSRLGLAAQRITTQEPDDNMIECAIAAVIQCVTP